LQASLIPQPTANLFFKKPAHPAAANLLINSCFRVNNSRIAGASADSILTPAADWFSFITIRTKGFRAPRISFLIS